MSVAVAVPRTLRGLTDGADTFHTEPGTVADALRRLAETYPQVRRRLFADDGRLLWFVHIVKNDISVKSLDGLATPVGPGDTVRILVATAGG